jgi:uncharacterized protein (TIGR02117 family)
MSLDKILLRCTCDITSKRWFRVLLLFVAAICAACAVPVRDATAWDDNEPYKTIYLVSHGWHAGIVLRRSDITGSDWPPASDFPDAQYLEVGWGDRHYYQTPDPHLGLILKAALLPTASVLHLVGFDGSVPVYFPNSEIISIKLSATGFTRLSRAIATSFALDEAGNARSLGSGLYGNSHFYSSIESYHLFNTCNVWVARMLRTAGLPVTPARAISVESLMSQVRKFGKVIQSEPEVSD